MVYKIGIKEENWTYLTVEASSEDEAREMAQEEYDSGNIYWDNTETEVMVSQ